MQLPIEQRCAQAIVLRTLLQATKTLFEEKYDKVELLITWRGVLTPMDEAVEESIDSLLTDGPVDHEFDSIDLYTQHALMSTFLETMRQNGVEPKGEYFQLSKSLFRLADLQERLEIEFMQELEDELDEDEDEDYETGF